ncbi:MAG: O-antigen ligase family protein [Halobacteriovoraceae bacterium]|nr:O-antigen ligase family protein [Halobacteriovoraceae bacterium]
MIGYLQFFGFDLLSSFTKSSFPTSLFGHRNRISEILGLSAIIQIISLIETNKKKITIPKTLILSATLSFISLFYTRSVILGISLSFSIIIFLKFRENKTKLISLFFLTFLGSAILLNIASTNVYKQYGLKVGSAGLRITKWKNTSAMIFKNPEGVGLGNFEFGYIPYDDFFEYDRESTEKIVVKSPHNGYLEVMSEIGFLSIFPILFLFYFLLHGTFQKIHNMHYLFSFSLIIYFCNQLMWAFPLETPFLFGFFAFLLGISLKLLIPQNIALSTKQIKILFIPLFISILLVGCFFTASHYIEFNKRNNLRLTRVGCRLYPSNWRLCIQKGFLEEKNGNYTKAIGTFNSVIRRMPHHYVAILHLAITYSKMENQVEACKHYQKYNQLFNGKSSINSYVLKNCIQ